MLGAVAEIRYYQALTAEIIQLLKKERERRKFSKYAVARHSGISQSMLSLVERGLRNPTMELMLRLADGIGIDLSVVIKAARSNVKKSDANSR